MSQRIDTTDSLDDAFLLVRPEPDSTVLVVQDDTGRRLLDVKADGTYTLDPADAPEVVRLWVAEHMRRLEADWNSLP